MNNDYCRFVVVTVKVHGSFHLTLKTFRNLFNHSNLRIPCVIVQNSGSVLDLAITFKFLLFQVIKLSLRKVGTVTIVDLSCTINPV